MGAIFAQVLLFTAVAVAAEQIEADQGDDDQDGELEYSVGLEGDEPKAVTPVDSDPDDGLVWVGLPQVANASEGEDACIDYRWVRLDPDEVEQAEREAWEAISYLYSNVDELEGLRPEQECAVDPAEDLPPQVVREAVRETVVDHLPRPEPEIPPGWALTGMPAYLVTGSGHALDYGPGEHEVDLGVMEVTVVVSGEGTTTVDWGDGTEPRTYGQPGRPYPDGQVRHAYADTGTVDVEVVDSWRVVFEVRHEGAVLISDVAEFDLAPVTLEDLEVRELRAVRAAPG